MDLTAIFITLFKLMVLLVLGYILNKKKVLDKHSNLAVSALIVNITNPSLILGALSSTAGTDRTEVLHLTFFGLGFYVLLPVIAWIIVHLLRVKKPSRGVTELLIIFSNTGFMAVPILQTLYGDVAVFYINIMNMPFNFLIYTYGIYLILRDKQQAALSEKTGPAGTESAPEKLPFNPKLFLSPGIVASLIALFLYFAEIRLPAFLSETFSFIGALTPPLSMLLVGSILAEYPLKGLLSDWKLDTALILKLFLLPAAAGALSLFIFHDPVLIAITTLTFAMPSGALCPMLAKNYGGDAKTAARGVLISTVLSLLTIPACYYLISLLLQSRGL